MPPAQLGCSMAAARWLTLLLVAAGPMLYILDAANFKWSATVSYASGTTSVVVDDIALTMMG
jgi:hypothetical protein